MKNMNREATLEKEKEWYGKDGRIDACFQLIWSIIQGWEIEDRFQLKYLICYFIGFIGGLVSSLAPHSILRQKTLENLLGVGIEKKPLIVTYMANGQWRDSMDSDHMNDAVDSAIHLPLLVYINGAVEIGKE